MTEYGVIFINNSNIIINNTKHDDDKHYDYDSVDHNNSNFEILSWLTVYNGKTFNSQISTKI